MSSSDADGGGDGLRARLTVARGEDEFSAAEQSRAGALVGTCDSETEDSAASSVTLRPWEAAGAGDAEGGHGSDLEDDADFESGGGFAPDDGEDESAAEPDEMSESGSESDEEVARRREEASVPVHVDASGSDAYESDASIGGAPVSRGPGDGAALVDTDNSTACDSDASSGDSDYAPPSPPLPPPALTRLATPTPRRSRKQVSAQKYLDGMSYRRPRSPLDPHFLEFIDTKDVASLKEACRKLGVPATGRKADLKERVREALRDAGAAAAGNRGRGGEDAWLDEARRMIFENPASTSEGLCRKLRDVSVSEATPQRRTPFGRRKTGPSADKENLASRNARVGGKGGVRRGERDGK